MDPLPRTYYWMEYMMSSQDDCCPACRISAQESRLSQDFQYVSSLYSDPIQGYNNLPVHFRQYGKVYCAKCGAFITQTRRGRELEQSGAVEESSLTRRMLESGCSRPPKCTVRAA